MPSNADGVVLVSISEECLSKDNKSGRLLCKRGCGTQQARSINRRWAPDGLGEDGRIMNRENTLSCDNKVCHHDKNMCDGCGNMGRVVRRCHCHHNTRLIGENTACQTMEIFLDSHNDLMHRCGGKRLTDIVVVARLLWRRAFDGHCSC